MKLQNILIASLIIFASVMGANAETLSDVPIISDMPIINENFVLYKGNIATSIISTNMLYEEESEMTIVWLENENQIIGKQKIEGPIGLKSGRLIYVFPPPNAVWYVWIR